MKKLLIILLLIVGCEENKLQLKLKKPILLVAGLLNVGQ